MVLWHVGAFWAIIDLSFANWDNIQLLMFGAFRLLYGMCHILRFNFVGIANPLVLVPHFR